MLSFGKGKQPETSIKLETRNFRKIKDISIEASSANGLATCVVKIGDTTVIEKLTEKHSDNNPVSWIRSGVIDSLAGDIFIEFVTPPYDSSRAEDETYLAPGAVNLKTIMITFAEESEVQYKNEYTVDDLWDVNTEKDYHEEKKN